MASSAEVGTSAAVAALAIAMDVGTAAEAMVVAETALFEAYLVAAAMEVAPATASR